MQLDGGPIIFVMRSFHPSAAGYHGKRKPNCLLLLICHFVLAFALLAGRPSLPGWLMPLCDRARSEKRYVAHNNAGAPSNVCSLHGNFSKEEIERKTINALQEMMGPDPIFVGELNLLYAYTLPADERALYAIRRYLGVKTERHADFMELAKLYHMWNHSCHPKRGQVVSGLSKIAARQRLADEPVAHTIHIGFAEEEDDADGMEQARQLLESAAELDVHMTTCFQLGLSISLLSSQDVPYLRDSAAQILMSLTQQIYSVSHLYVHPTKGSK